MTKRFRPSRPGRALKPLARLVFLLAFASRAAAAPLQTDGFLEEAVALKNQGRLEEAEGCLKEGLAFSPARADLHFELATVYALRHDAMKRAGEDDEAARLLEAAGRELEQVVMVSPDSVPAHFNLGVVYKKQGKYTAARDQFKEVLHLDPAQSAARLEIGATYEDQGFFDDARAVYLDAREHDYGNQEIETALAELEHRKAEAARAAAERPAPALGSFGSLSAPGQSLFSQNSQAGEQNAKQALPQLGMWLARELMKGRQQHSDAS